MKLNSRHIYGLPLSGRLLKMFLVTIFLVTLQLGCGSQTSPITSRGAVSDVKHTPVKRQSIGNCWLYAHSTWLESLYLDQHNETLNVSESYWTWWHWYDQLLEEGGDQLQTGGHWWTSSNIISNHGFVLEGEFLPDEADDEMSWAQSRAEMLVNYELGEGGKLEHPEERTPELVRTVLDEAFGSNMAEAEKLKRSASQVQLGSTSEGKPITLADSLGYGPHSWRYVWFPSIYGKNAKPSEHQVKERKSLLKRVFRAVNDYHPVVMSTMIDFNALDITDTMFKKSTLDASGSLGVQGGHMLVLEDYVVANVPDIGTIGEGDTDADTKSKAVEGDLVYLVAKNSWGTNRPDRGLTDGYSRFDRDYLFEQLEWKHGDSDDDASATSYYTTLSGFILPPGY